MARFGLCGLCFVLFPSIIIVFMPEGVYSFVLVALGLMAVCLFCEVSFAVSYDY